jgi:hypothetical protein
MKEFKHLKDKNGFSINGWMVREYGLAGNELLAFGLVFSLSQGSAGQYTGGIPFMAEFFGWSPNTCRKYLRILVAKGMLKESRGDIEGVPFCNYFVTDSVMESHPSRNEGYTSRNEVSPLQDLHPDTLQNLKVNNKEEVNKKRIIPSLSDVIAYAAEREKAGRPHIEAENFFNHYTANGWKQKGGQPIVDWQAAFRTWESFRIKDQNTTTTTKRQTIKWSEIRK